MREVALLMLLSLANAQRSLSSITCDVPCQPDEFKADPLVVLCGGGLCTTTVTLRKGKMQNVISLPVGTKGVELRMEANDDMDINLHDATDGICIAGAQCQDSTFEAVQGCGSVEDYCLQYQGMSWYFSGDEEDNPVVETLKLSPQGNVTVPLEVTVQAASQSEAQVSATNGPFDDCPAQLPGCRSCSEYTGCSLIETPMCDGSATVVCAAPTSTSSTGTSFTTTSTTLSTTSVTSTSISVTTTSTVTETSTTRSSTMSTSSTSLSSTATTLTRSTTSSISTTRSSTSITDSSTSLTSETSTTTSTAETKTSSTTTSLTFSSTTRSFTKTTSTTQSQTSSSSITKTWTRSSTMTTSSTTTSQTSVTKTISTSTSGTTTATTLTQSSTSSLTTTRSTVTTSSTTRSSSITSVTRSSTGTRTTVTLTSSSTRTTTWSSTRTSVTRTSSSSSSTSISHSSTKTSLTSSSITATSSSTSITMTTTSLTETSSSSSMTSTSSSITSTVTCGCCSSCLGWAMMIGCGSFDLCQRQLEECQTASLTCQGNLQGYQIGLEQCRNREAFLDATVASLTSQLSSQNCTGFVAEDDSETALWLLVILVVLLILALVLLLILCWRLRSKHQATKEQLAHCQDELFTRPQTSKQEKQEPGLQRQMRKLQRELDDANQKLAAKAAMEFKLQQMQERLGKEEENVRRGQELWKLNKSMYSILRQVVQDSRDFAQGVRDAGEKAPAVKQRIEQFEAKLAISSGRRDAAEAELAMLKNEGAGRGQPSEVDTTCDSESPICISTGGRLVRSKESHASHAASSAAFPGEVPMESPRLVLQVEAEPPDPPKVESPAFTAVAPTGPPAAAFAPKERVKRGLSRQESKIEQVLAERLDLTPGNLREGLRQVGQKAKERSMVLERVLSKRLDEAKVQPNESNGEIPVEPMTSTPSEAQ